MIDLPIAVTGATGALGRLVATRLAAAGEAPRLIVRDPQRAPRIAGADVRVASDYAASDEMRAALDGAGTLLLIPGREHPDRVGQHTAAVDAAVAAGLRRIVYLSFVGAAPDATFTLARDHWATEEHIRAAGLPFTFLRMSLYLDMLPVMVGSDLVLRGPAGDGHVAPVARADVADTAVAALLGGGDHDGQTLDVTGAQRLTLADAATTMAHEAGRDIRFEDETPEHAYASRAHFGAPDWEVAGWVTSYTAIAAGELDVVSTTVADLTGHEPATLAAWIRANPRTLAHII